jgi:hypothetical protein
MHSDRPLFVDLGVKMVDESVGLRGSFCRERGSDIDFPHDTEMKSPICENADEEDAYNGSHLCGYIMSYGLMDYEVL